MTWFTLIPSLLVALALVVIPGLAVLYPLQLRGLTMWALAGPIGISLIAGSAVVAGLMQIRYSVWSLVSATLFAGAASLIGTRFRGIFARRRLRIRTSVPIEVSRSRGTWTAWCLVVTGAVILWRVMTIIGAPDNISQTFDDIYHLNSVRYILDTGNASSLTVGQLVDPQNRWAAYPAAWHDFAALVAQLSGVAIPEAVNSVNIVICSVLWPAGAIYFVDTVVTSSKTARALAAAGAAGFSQFPYLMLDFGVLYPTLLATAIVPSTLAILIRATNPERRSAETGYGAWIALVFTVPGLALAHPSGILAVLAFGLPWLVWCWVGAFRRALVRGTWRTILVSAAAAGFTAALFIVWKYLRPDPVAATWLPYQSLAQAFGEVITASAMGRPIPLVFAGLLACGLYAVATKRRFGLVLTTFSIGSGLYVVVSGLWFGRFRGFLTGGWYSDSYRIAALLPIVTLPLVVIGGLWLAERAELYAKRRLLVISSKIVRSSLVAVALPMALLLAMFGLTQIRTIGSEVRNAAHNFEFGPDSALLSSDERAVLQRLPDYVPPGQTVIGSPWTGASLVYAYTGRPALLPHAQGTHGPDAEIVLNKLNRVVSAPEVCAALDRLNSRYVLDFGPREVHDGRHDYPGLDDLDQAPGIQKIYSVGDAILYSVTACSP